MSPRAGGEADKFGNRYEGAWIVRHLLYVLHRDGESVTVEDVGDLAKGAEFTYRRAGGVEVHQLKRQHGTANSWTVKSLHSMGVWKNARLHVEAGREFHFVSTVPSRVLQELCVAGGALVVFAAMEWGIDDLLRAVVAGEDSAARKGAAGVCAHRLPHTSNASVAGATLAALVEDGDEDVRKAAAEVAGALRGHALRPFDAVIKALVASPTFSHALPQLLITLERAPDRVDEVALLCAQRFVRVFHAEAADIRTGAAGGARGVGQLIIRGMAQSRTRAERAALLDVLDELLLIGAHGLDEVLSTSERDLL